MIATETDIMALVDRVQRAGEVLREAREAWQVASDAFEAAGVAVREASTRFDLAQNDLVVAAGGTDRSFVWGLETSTVQVAQK